MKIGDRVAAQVGVVPQGKGAVDWVSPDGRWAFVRLDNGGDSPYRATELEVLPIVEEIARLAHR